jgi:hypothetical protein
MERHERRSKSFDFTLLASRDNRLISVRDEVKRSLPASPESLASPSIRPTSQTSNKLLFCLTKLSDRKRRPVSHPAMRIS